MHRSTPSKKFNFIYGYLSINLFICCNILHDGTVGNNSNKAVIIGVSAGRASILFLLTTFFLGLPFVF